jgi:spermidine synthase
MAIPGKEIFRCYDNIGPVQVLDDGNKRYLAFGSDDEQSCQLKAQPTQLQYEYTRAMLLVLLFNSDPRRALLLGLGGGSLAGCLHEHWPSLSITAVELRRTVIDIAHRYFQLPRDERLEVLEADAGDYLRRNEPNNFDLIFSDIYDAEGVDDLQLQERYLDQCLACLSDDGWLVLNCWREHRSQTDFLQTLKQRFADVRVCMTQSGNWIILCGRKSVKTSDKQLRQQAKALGSQLGFSLQTPLGKLRPVR